LMATADAALRVLTFTWNVGNKKPLKEELELWCPSAGGGFDLVVVGTQENSFSEKTKPSSKKKKQQQQQGAASASKEEASIETELDDDEVIEQCLRNDELNDESSSPLKPTRKPSRSTRSMRSSARISRHPPTPHRHPASLSLSKDLALKLSFGSKQDALSQALDLRLDHGRRQKQHTRTVWDSMVSERLGNDYAVVKHVVLWEMRLTIYARKRYVASGSGCISHVQASRSATGIGGVLGNKGGLVISLCFGHTSLCFISCHLAAHSHKWRDRDENCVEVLRETMRDVGSPTLDAVSEFDHVFWMGDLNYRVDLNMNPDNLDKCSTYAKALRLNKSRRLSMAGSNVTPNVRYGTEALILEEVKKYIAEEDWEKLMEHDQLRASQKNGRSFVGFLEGPMHFAPTFKVERRPGVHHKDQRIPSYCDRILWKSMPCKQGNVKQTLLASVPGVSTSDHKPVCAHFEITPSREIERLTLGNVIKEGMDVTHPLRGAGVVTHIEHRSFGGTLYHVNYVVDGSTRKYKADSLYKLSMGGLRLIPFFKPTPLDILRFKSRKAREGLPCPVLHFSFIEVSGLRDSDYRGGSDPYLVFESNPPDLFAVHADPPISTIKKQMARARVESFADSMLTRKTSAGDLSFDSKEDAMLHIITNTWQETELPVLRPVIKAEGLLDLTVIISVYDFDAIGYDDPMGTVIVPLAPPGGLETLRNSTSYDIEIEQPLVIYGLTHDSGMLRGKLTVSFGDGIPAAVEAVEAAGAGKDAMTLHQITSRWYHFFTFLRTGLRVRRMQAASDEAKFGESSKSPNMSSRSVRRKEKEAPSAIVLKRSSGGLTADSKSEGSSAPPVVEAATPVSPAPRAVSFDSA